MIETNKVVSINYEVIDTLTNEVIDSSDKNNKPLEFITGYGQVIEGLEREIMKANVGDSLKFNVLPEHGYGVRDPGLMQEIGREQFGDIELEKGMTLFGQSDNGMPVQVIVADFNANNVLIDYNHPLAGKTLGFNVKVLSVRDATDDEILATTGGGGCGCSSGGMSHGSGGGCCGGGCGCSH